MKKILNITFVVSALIYILAIYFDNDFVRTVTKPIPLIALLLLIKPNYTYSKLIFVGFIFSLFGDVFLMKIVDNFILGLASFLIAHVFYIFAFINRKSDAKWLTSIPFYLIAIALALFLNSHLGDMKLPVFAYIFVIMTMVWRSFIQISSAKYALWAFIGAVFFAFSDSCIAYSKFYAAFEYSEYLIISTYWLAQYMIYISTTQTNKK